MVYSNSKTALRPLAVVLLLVMLMGTLMGQSNIPTFRARVNLTTVTFTARDSNGKLVGDLAQPEVAVDEDGVRQNIRFFARTSELPLAIGLVVDASESQAKFFKRHTKDVEDFLRDVLGPGDRAFLIGFGNHIRLVSDLSSSPTEILSQFERYSRNKYSGMPELGEPEIREEGTALHDAVYLAAMKLHDAQKSRRVLVIFSDGEDNSSAHDEDDALDAAADEDVIVYTVRYTEHKVKRYTSRDKYGTRVLHKLAANTGGSEYDAQTSDMDEVFRSIGAELHSLYELGYYPTDSNRDGTFRKVRVTISRSGVTVRTKPGYYARP